MRDLSAPEYDISDEGFDVYYDTSKRPLGQRLLTVIGEFVSRRGQKPTLIVMNPIEAQEAGLASMNLPPGLRVATRRTVARHNFFCGYDVPGNQHWLTPDSYYPKAVSLQKEEVAA